MEALLATSPPTPQLSAHLHLRRPSRGVVGPTGHVVVRDDASGQHLHSHAAEACFGEWAAAMPRAHGDGGGASSVGPVVYELALMPEEAIYLACVAGCLEVAPDAGVSTARASECPPGGAAALGRLLELAVAADPTLAALARGRSSGDGGASAASQGRALALRCALLRAVVYAHYRHGGYVVKDGVLLGCHFLLYRGAPSAVHSDYGVWLLAAERDRHTLLAEEEAPTATIAASVAAAEIDAPGRTPPAPGALTWQHIQALRRLLHDVAKKLLLCSLEGGGGDGDALRVVDLSVG